MNKNILVTGSHRSGSTWVGNVISKGKNVRYVHEPFNISNKKNNPPLKFWFENLNYRNSSFQNHFKSYFESFYKIFSFYNFNRFLKVKSSKEIRYWLSDLKNRFNSRTVFKDPIALMSAEWLNENYNLKTVVLVRHPAAFIASLKVKNWKFDFNNFLNQNELLEEYFQKYKSQIKEYSEKEYDLISQGILLWNIIHEVILIYKSKYENEWYFVKHEDLSEEPFIEFEKMFNFLELDFDSNVVNYLKDSTESKINESYIRDSKANIKSWKKKLTADEILIIKMGTQKVWDKFYTENDWD